MRIEERTFFSDGLKLSACFFVPDSYEPGRRRPLVITCSGFTGLCSIHPARFARCFTAEGRLCFGFDYRGFAASEGQRGRVILEEQVRDIIHAVACAASDNRVDPERIILLGWGMGAGLVLDAARELPGVQAIAAINGFYDGKRVQMAHRGEGALADFCERVARERARCVECGQATRTDPFNLYPLDAQSRTYVDNVLRRNSDYDTEGYSYELADSLLRWRPEAYAPAMRIPLLIAHGEKNMLHPVTEAESLHRLYGGPKELYWIEGAGHTEWMHDEDPKFRALGQRICAWMDQWI